MQVSGSLMFYSIATVSSVMCSVYSDSLQCRVRMVKRSTAVSALYRCKQLRLMLSRNYRMLTYTSARCNRGSTVVYNARTTEQLLMSHFTLHHTITLIT
jgi:hypothetical protein